MNSLLFSETIPHGEKLAGWSCECSETPSLSPRGYDMGDNTRIASVKGNGRTAAEAAAHGSGRR
jgi:hypothetical protein